MFKISKIKKSVISADPLAINGCSVIICVRNEDRIKLLNKCINSIKKQKDISYEIIIVEEDDTQKFDIKGKDITKIFIKSKLPFCKSKCFNAGVSISSYNCICGLDCDFILKQEDFLIKGCEQLKKYHACFLADDIEYLNENGKCSGETWKKDRANWQFHGGSFFIRKESYINIGGFYEAFVGYGSEDTEFYTRVHKNLQVSPVKGVIVQHQHHKRDFDLFINVSKNENILKTMLKTPNKRRIELVKQANTYLK